MMRGKGDVVSGWKNKLQVSRPLDLRTVVRRRGTLHEAGVVFEHSVLLST